MEQLPTLKP